MKKIIFLIILLVNFIWINEAESKILVSYRMKGNINHLAWRSLTIQNYKNKILIDLGNFIAPHYLAAISKGEDVIKLYNRLNYNFVVPGYHEFDYGLDCFKRNMKKSKFDWISANLKIDGVRLNPFIIEKIHHKKIAFIGLTDIKFLEKVNRKVLPAVSLQNLEKSIRETIEKIPEDCKIVVVGNIKYENIKNISIKFPRVKYYIIPAFDETEYLRFENRNFNFIRYDYLNFLTSKMDGVEYKKPVKRDPSIETLMENLKRSYNGYENIGELNGNLYRNVMNIIREKMKVELVFFNGGTFYKYKEGKLTGNDLKALFPYPDKLFSFKISGKELKKLYKFGKSRKSENQKLFFSNMKIKGGKLFLNGLVVKDKEIYHAATNEFIKNGGDGYNSLKKLRIKSISKETLYNIVKNYIKNHKVVKASDFSYLDRKIKRLTELNVDFSYSDVDYSNKDLYKKEGISQLSGNNEKIAKTNLDYIINDVSKYVNNSYELKIKADHNRGVNNNSTINFISRFSKPGKAKKIEFKIDSSFKKVNGEIPLLAYFTYLDKYKWFFGGLSLNYNYRTKDSSAGIQAYTSKNFRLFNMFNFKNKLDVFAGLTGEKPLIFKFDSRLELPTHKNYSYFISFNDYLYRNKIIKTWARRRNIYTGITFKFYGKKY